MKKEIGISVLLFVLCAVTSVLNPKFLSPVNLVNTANLIGLYGVFSLGLGLVIITGGIDLSVGSMCALTGVILAMAVSEWKWGSAQLSARDIKDPQALVLKLQDTNNPVSIFVWGKFSESERQSILTANSDSIKKTEELSRKIAAASDAHALTNTFYETEHPAYRDIKDPQALVLKWQDKSNPLYTNVWGEFSKSERQDILTTSSDTAKKVGELSEKIVAAVDAEVITKPLYEKNRFAGITTSGISDANLKRVPSGSSLIKLNRHLLEAAYPQEISSQRKWPWPAAAALVLFISMVLGWLHGTLVTRAKLQPFIVTLCGLLLYRGIARFIAGDSTKGFSGAENIETLRSLASGKIFGMPAPFAILIVLSIVMCFVLHRSIYGRYLLAVGRNEQAARFSGINTQLVTASAYTIAGLLTGISGILIAFYTNSVGPSNHGNFYELYGIAAAVLGGCSLRGGEGSVIGIVIGTALLLVLQNLVNLVGIPSSLNFAVMGAVVLFGVLADQMFKNRAAKKTVRAVK